MTITATLPAAPVFPAADGGEGEESYAVALGEALAAVKRGEHEAALPLLRGAARRTADGNDVVLYNLGRVLGHIDGTAGRRPVEAIARLQRCTELNPLNARCWLYICVSKVQAGDMRGAAEVFERAWGLLPLSLHDDEANEEMKLVKRLRGIFQQSGQEAAAGGRGGGAEL